MKKKKIKPSMWLKVLMSPAELADFLKHDGGRKILFNSTRPRLPDLGLES